MKVSSISSLAIFLQVSSMFSLALVLMSVGGCRSCSSRQPLDWEARLLLYIRNNSLAEIEGLLGEGRLDVTKVMW